MKFGNRCHLLIWKLWKKKNQVYIFDMRENVLYGCLNISFTLGVFFFFFCGLILLEILIWLREEIQNRERREQIWKETKRGGIIVVLIYCLE